MSKGPQIPRDLEELQEILQSDPSISPSRVAETLGIPRTTFYSRRESLRKWLAKHLPETLPEVFAPVKQESPEPLVDLPLLRVQEEVKVLRAEARALRREAVHASEIRKAVFKLEDVVLDPPDWVRKSAGRPKKGSPGVPTAILSDLHWGEVVRPEETRGRNAYNSQIARQRLRRWVDGVIELCFDYHVNPDYPGIVVPLGGDIFSGGIHPELNDTDDQPIAPALLDVAQHLAASLKMLADHFGRVFCPCVEGNHDRMSEKPRFKSRVWHSWGWLLYQMLERHFKDVGDERVVFAISDETDVLYEAGGRKYLLTHGDNLGTGGGNGIIGAIGPIRRGSYKVAEQYRQLGDNYDTIVMGHWHQPIALHDVIVNNTTKGWDEYARLKLRAPYTPASQLLWFTHPSRGIVRTEEIFLTHPSETEGATEWVQWQQGKS